MSSRNRKSILLTALVLPAVLAGLFAWPQTDAGQAETIKLPGQDKLIPKVKDERESPSNNYGFSDPTPSGRWSVRADFDSLQIDDPSVPVVIASIRSYAGKGNFGNQLMIESVTLVNRLPTKIAGVKIGWIIIAKKDRNAGRNREAALVNGYTSLLNPAGKNSQFKKLKALYIDFVKEAKGLVKAGTLNGDFSLRPRVSEVHFEDGSSWYEGARSDRRRKQFAHSRSSKPQYQCPKQVCFFDQNGQGTCEDDQLSTSYCRRENCNPNDPNACYCNLYSCSTCQDVDQDGVSTCDDDCDDEDNRRYPGNWENLGSNCSDGVDNDCDDETDCDDFLCTYECEEDCGYAPGPLGKSLGKDISPRSEGCCDPMEAFNCMNGGGNWYESICACLSPIVIDVAGNGFNLTSASSGVLFDAARIGFREQISWTAPDSDDAWLTLDRNENGLIDDGKELFGSVTPQAATSPGEGKNGFRALAMYDKAKLGGNADGLIDRRDRVFYDLLLW